MSEHGPSFSLGTASKLPNQTFFSWLRSETALYLGQLIGFIAGAASLIYYVAGSIEHTEPIKGETIRIALFYAHLIFICGFIATILRMLKLNETGQHRVKKVYDNVFVTKGEAGISDDQKEALLKKSLKNLRRYKWNFLWFWVITLLQYVAFTGQLYTDKPGQDHAPFLIVLVQFLPVTLNTIALTFIFKCFLIVYVPARTKKKDETREKYKEWSNYFMCFVVVAFILLSSGMWCWDISAWGRNLVNQLLEALSGVLYAVAMSLLIARMDSKFIGLPSWLVSVLFFYAAVQPMMVVFSQPGEIFEILKTAFFIIAFIFKIYFFLIITYTIQNGRILNYLFCNDELTSRVDDAIKKEQNQEDKKMLSFRDWICKKVKPRYDNYVLNFLVFVLSVVAAVLYLWAVNTEIAGLPHYKYNMCRAVFNVLNVFFIVLVIKYIYNNYEGYINAASSVASIYNYIFHDIIEESHIDSYRITLRKFKNYFLYFWGCMLVLYAIYCVEPFLPPCCYKLDRYARYVPHASGLSYLLYALIKIAPDLMGSMFIFWCFSIFYKPGNDDHSKKSRYMMKYFSIYAFCIFFMFFAMIGFSVSPASVLGWGAQPFSKDGLEAFSTMLEAINDTITAVSLALLIACFDDVMTDLRTGLIVALYVYAAVQPLFVMSWQEDLMDQYVTGFLYVVVFFLKIYLFVLVTYAIQTQRFLNFLACFPALEKKVDCIFANQFEIKLLREGEKEEFHIHICNHDKPVMHVNFENDKHDRKKCIEYVEELQNRFITGEITLTVPQIAKCDSFCVEMIMKDIMIGFSESFKSKEDAEEFMKEVAEKMPHCKVNFGM